MKKGTFTINNKTYKGYSFGKKWNGFEVPYFDEQTAEKIIKDCEVGEEEKGEGIDIKVDGKQLKVFPVGKCSWAWGK